MASLGRASSITSRDVFISHSSDDADAARALRAVIEAAGHTCWMAPDDIVGTEAWTEQDHRSAVSRYRAQRFPELSHPRDDSTDSTIDFEDGRRTIAAMAGGGI